MLLSMLFALIFSANSNAAPVGLDCSRQPCAHILPGASRFEAVPDKPYLMGVNDSAETVGWVGMSSDLVDIKGYSGKPLHTLVGIDEAGKIIGSEIVHHTEPILLVGIPEWKLTDFVDAHVGLLASDKISTGRSSDGSRHIDGISGATVTVLSESQTIMSTARVMAEDVGAIRDASRVPGHFVSGQPLERWRQVKKYLGHLVIKQEEVGEEASDRPYVSLWFGMIDSPQIGVPLLGETRWKWAIEKLAEDEHLFVVFNSGTNSFKGSGFVRGGVFDRFRLEQGLKTITFRDLDYQSIPTPQIPGTPMFSEGGLFVIRGAQVDPGQAYDLVYLASPYVTSRGAFERDFFTFRVTQRLSRKLYVLDGPDPDDEVWRNAWELGWWRALIVASFYLFVGGLFVARKWTAKTMSRLTTVHRRTAIVSFFVLGLGLHVQPSITQVMTLSGHLISGTDWRLYLSEPSIYVSWIGVAAVLFLWGRGVFCGWICPYGSLAELTFLVGRKLSLREFEFSERAHFILRNLRYVILGLLIATFLYRPEVGELLAEVEPFKSTFLVPLWKRHWAAILWWLVLFSWSLFTYRPFCRYLCPLGAALAVPTSLRLMSPHRHDFCTKCKICTRVCHARAIRADGSIDARECLNCWECEATWQDDQVCPVMVKALRRMKPKRLRSGRC